MSESKILSNSQNLQILFEDNHLLIVNKRAGDIVQSDKTGDLALNEVVKQYVKKKFQKPGEVFLGTVHRLDRPVSGALIFARTSKALSRLNEMLKAKKISKIYWAIVEGEPEMQAELKCWMIKDEAKNKSRCLSKELPGSKHAVLRYKQLKRGDRYTLLEVELETGRHHQIRAQLSHARCVIKGDLKYGAKRSNPNGAISLHARYLEFVHPVTKEMLKITAPLPEGDIWKQIAP